MLSQKENNSNAGVNGEKFSDLLCFTQILRGRMLSIKDFLNERQFGLEIDTSHGGISACLSREGIMTPVVLTRAFIHGYRGNIQDLTESSSHAVSPYGDLTRATALLTIGRTSGGRYPLLSANIVAQPILAGDFTCFPDASVEERYARERITEFLRVYNPGADGSFAVHCSPERLLSNPDRLLIASAQHSLDPVSLDVNPSSKFEMTDLSVFN